MDTTEQNDQPSPAPAQKPKRKYRRRAVAKPRSLAAAAAPAAPEKPAYLEGMTATACARACNKDGCVISGKPYCAHPHKGGLQNRDIGDADCVNRFTAARLLLGTEALEKRFGK